VVFRSKAQCEGNGYSYGFRVLTPLCGGTDQNSGFIFTIDDESKGLDMKRDSEIGLALGVGALCKAAIGQ
jgi:hypothetical protein